MEEDFDFDYWCALAAGNPVRFFAAREACLRGFIARRAPAEARRLQAFQANIDESRILSGTPMRALEGLFGMLEERLEALRLETARL